MRSTLPRRPRPLAPGLALAAATLLLGQAPRLLGGNWPSFAGDGSFTPPVEGIPLIDHPREARLAWTLAHPMGIQKSNAARPGEFYGGTAGLVVADGLVFANYFRPAGDALNERTVNRYYPIARQPVSVRRIDADDVFLAIHAGNGTVAWAHSDRGAGLNFLFGKRGHYGVTPACGDGIVAFWGALGHIVAFDAASGTRKWQARASTFHAAASSAKQNALANRALPDTYGNAPLFENLRTGLVVAGGNVVAPDGFGGLIGLSTATGEQRWATPDVIARGATPAIWRHNDRPYLLCPTGNRDRGKVTLIDPRNGHVLWSRPLDGPAHTSLVVGGNRVLLNTRGNLLNGREGPGKDRRAASGLFACFELSTQGATERWRLDDAPENWHPIRPDRGMNRRVAIRDGIGYLLLGTETTRLVTVDMETGKVLSRGADELPGTACSPLLAENRLFLPLDLAHSWDAVRIALFELLPGGQTRRLGDIDPPNRLRIDPVTDYEVASELPYANGLLFTKTRAGVAAIDLRK